MEMNFKANANMTNSSRRMKFDRIKKTAEFKYSHQIIIYRFFFLLQRIYYQISYMSNVFSICVRRADRDQKAAN